jgi:cytochrome c-type biogenesis protein CcmH/NrfG
MPDLLFLAAGLALAAAFVLLPLRREPRDEAADDALETARLRHRVSLEALRDVEVDRRAGSLDEHAYREQLAAAEARAAETARAVAAHPATRMAAASDGPGRRVAVVAAAVIGLALIAGWAVPATGIANETILNEPLAAAEEAERARQARIAELRDALAADPTNAATLSALADAHLAGTSSDDLARAAAALQLLIAAEPDRADAYERILAAYLRAGDHANARAAYRSYAQRPTADPAELAFFDGLIALRGENDLEAARAAFDRFLELAPDDPRAPMIRSLRDEAGP